MISIIVLLIIIAILAFTFVVFIHELGHFLTAKWCGIRVNEFAIGMGPRIIKWGKKETKYSIRLFPIGGFCAMEGEDSKSDDERAFGNKAVWKRMIVVCAGAVMNIILGFILALVLSAQQPAFASNRISMFADSGSALQDAGVQVSHKRVLELSYEDVKSAKNGLIVITPDFDNFTAKLIAADEYSKYMTETPILEGVANREYYGRSATSIENKSTIEYGTEQGLAALIYGEQGVSSLPIQDITGEYIDTDNEYMYYYSAEFVK